MKLKFCHPVPLEISFLLVSFFVEVKFFRFRPKTVDYKAFFYFSLVL